MTNLLKEWRRIKHSPQYEHRSARHNALTEVIQSRWQAPRGQGSVPHLNVVFTRLMRRGVLLANVPDAILSRLGGGWSTQPDRYQFLSTARHWLALMHKTPMGFINHQSDLKPYLDQIGYVLLDGTIVAKRNAVVGYKGAYFNRKYAEETFVGWATPTWRVEIAALPKHLQAPAREWAATHPGVDGCVDAPLDLIDQDKLSYTDGAWRRPRPPTPFVITGIGNYHSSARHLRSLDHLGTDIRLGLEVELACPRGRRGSATGVSAAKFLNKHVHSRYTLVERDASVGNGFELVIAPASAAFHKTKLLALADTWRKLGEKTNPFKRCHDTDPRAGIHIHIDKRSVHNWAALSNFIGTTKRDEDYHPHWRWALFGRDAGYFCREYDGYNHPQSKYSAINDTHAATYEARVFSSSNDPKEWVAHIEVLTAIVAWTNGMLMFNAKRLTVAGFLKFLFAHSDEYPLAYARGFELHQQVTLERIAKADKGEPGYEIISYDECEDTNA